MDDSLTPLEARRQSRDRLIQAARVTLTGAAAGWLAGRLALDPATLVATGAMLILVPLNFLTASPVRPFLRIVGATSATMAVHSLIEPGYLTACLAALWLVIAAFAINSHLTRQ